MRGAISNILSLFKWVFVRLPKAFSVPFLILTVMWFVAGFRWVEEILVDPLSSVANGWARSLFPLGLADRLAYGLGPALSAVVILLIFLAGLVAAYNLCVALNWCAIKLQGKLGKGFIGEPVPPKPWVKKDGQVLKLENVQRIGIVLAGGGAKGAFQAGAMKAIYRFLEEQGALNKVKVVVGTSIGSWNALFWLANLVKPKDETWQGPSDHQRWWSNVSAKLLAPGWYVPLVRNSFLSTAPWRHVYDLMFGGDTAAGKQLRASPIHFYFTRSNVRTGALFCATNNLECKEIAGVKYDKKDSKDAKFLDWVRDAVFASMDLPPLFPYFPIGGNLFEDGGVIDNLPIQFAAIEGCDLMFILPLNSSFEEDNVDEASVFLRLMRVIDVRQGALERNEFSMLYLYNELAAAIGPAREALQKTGIPDAEKRLLAEIVKRDNRILTVFAICPERSYVNRTIGTAEFWKTSQAGEVFGKMSEKTWEALATFDPIEAVQKRVKLHLVNGETVSETDAF